MKAFTLKGILLFVVASLYLFLPGCNSLVSDPFQTPKVVVISKRFGDDHSSFQIDLANNRHVSSNRSSSSSSSSRYEKWMKKSNQMINGRFFPTFNPVQKFKSAIATTFLPNSYPKQTPEGYLSYSIWSWIQDLSTQLRGVLATQRVLEGVGVGREGATALSASLNFIVRDGCGMVSTLLFTALVSSKFRGDVKRWRLVADIVNDVGITLEVCATLVPRHFFLPMICAGNMFKAICGVAARACNGAINLHWAKGSDISDINAKFGAQHTVTGSLGLVFAALFARSVSTVPAAVLWSLYSFLTVLHIYANIKCLRLISFDYLNTIRLNMVINNFLEEQQKEEEEDDDEEGFAINSTCNSSIGDETKSTSNTSSSILKTISKKKKKKKKNTLSLQNPKQISKRELLFFQILPSVFHPCNRLKIRLGSSFQTIYQSINYMNSGNNDDASSSSSISLLNFYIDQLSRDNYCIVCCCGKKNMKKNEINISFGPDTDVLIKIKAYLMACMMRQHLIQMKSVNERIGLISNPITLRQFYVDVQSRMNVLWPLFVSSISDSGWDLAKTELDTEGYCVYLQKP